MFPLRIPYPFAPESTAGAVTHVTSGALSGSNAATTGAAARPATTTHATVAALVGAGAATSGAAARIALHITAAALAGAGAALAGAAALIRAPITHSTNGALSGLGSLLLGLVARPAVPIFEQVLAIPRAGLRIRTGQIFQLVLGAENKPIAYVGSRGMHVPIVVIDDDSRAMAVSAQGDLLQLI